MVLLIEDEESERSVGRFANERCSNVVIGRKADCVVTKKGEVG